MRKLALLIGVLGLTVGTFGFGTFGPIFVKQYGIKPDSTLGKAKCGVCHASAKGGKLNAYGEDLKTTLGSSKKLTADTLKAVEGKDSNKNGAKNIDDIKADKIPG